MKRFVTLSLSKKFKLNLLKQTIQVGLVPYLTFEKYHLKRNRLNNQMLFRKGASATRLNLRDCWKSSLKTENYNRAFCIIVVSSGAPNSYLS